MPEIKRFGVTDEGEKDWKDCCHADEEDSRIGFFSPKHYDSRCKHEQS